MALFKFAIEFDESADALTHGVKFYVEDNPVIKVPLKDEDPRDRFLDKSEVRVLWHLLDNSSMSPMRRNAF
ncbi:MAG TPA: hypothetical protein DCZ48_11230 [Methylococcaceae bacterium]|nr:hypothetical protein [Methylococcaceae bacterium]